MNLKKRLILLVIVVLLPTGIFAGTYSGGTGEPNDPYIIATAEDMNSIGAEPNDWDKHFLLVADINLADYTDTQFNIIGTQYSNAFTGVFDGNDHKIWNFTWSYFGNCYYIGLFGCVGPGGHIKNLGMENVNIIAPEGYEGVGGLVGCSYGGTITNCYSTGSVLGYFRTGGLVGFGSDSTIEKCYAKGSISGYGGVGGLVGVSSGYIENCYATGSVSGDVDIGGLVGGNGFQGMPATIINCYSTGNVSGENSVGGLVGRGAMSSMISDCYATGGVSGDVDIGGLVGFNVGSMINSCYSTGDVNGTDDHVGGLVGFGYDSTIEKCYAKGSVSGYGGVGGLVGYSDDSTIENCYATGSVSGDVDIGGLVGVSSGYIENCYATGAVDGNFHTGGLVGDGGIIASPSFWDIETGGPDNGIGTPLPTAQMQTERTFTDAGWDFIEIWDIGENQTYPFLRTHPAGDINHDDIVNFYDFAILADHWLEDMP